MSNKWKITRSEAYWKKKCFTTDDPIILELLDIVTGVSNNVGGGLEGNENCCQENSRF